MCDRLTSVRDHLTVLTAHNRPKSHCGDAATMKLELNQMRPAPLMPSYLISNGSTSPLAPAGAGVRLRRLGCPHERAAMVVVRAVGTHWAGRHRDGCAPVQTGPQVGQ
jgi:hypothetical protein